MGGSNGTRAAYTKPGKVLTETGRVTSLDLARGTIVIIRAGRAKDAMIVGANIEVGTCSPCAARRSPFPTWIRKST